VGVSGTRRRVTSLPLSIQWIATWMARHQERVIDYLKEENRVLREKLDSRVRLTDPERRRLAKLGHELGRKGLRDVACIASPDTILRWYRELVAKKYDGSTKRGPGRPLKPSEIVRLLIKMATENSGWGYTRLRGALRNLGHEIGRSTIKRILMEQGIDPAPLRGKKKTSWATFIKAHLGAITAADFFTVEVLSMAGLIRYHVFVLIDIATRKVEIAGIKADPSGAGCDRSPETCSTSKTASCSESAFWCWTPIRSTRPIFALPSNTPA
jgi:putative transposase